MQLIGKTEPHPFEKATDAAVPLICRRAERPQFFWKLERWLGIGQEKELVESMKGVRTWLHQKISEGLESSRTRRERTSPDKDNVVRSAIDLFVEHSRDEADVARPEDLVDFMTTFVLASRDTSALTLTWLLYALCKHPHVEKRLRKEKQSILPSLGVTKDTYLTTEHVKNLMYLEAVIKETLRLYPVGPAGLREVARDKSSVAISCCGRVSTFSYHRTRWRGALASGVMMLRIPNQSVELTIMAISSWFHHSSFSPVSQVQAPALV